MLSRNLSRKQRLRFANILRLRRFPIVRRSIPWLGKEPPLGVHPDSADTMRNISARNAVGQFASAVFLKAVERTGNLCLPSSSVAIVDDSPSGPSK